MISIFIWELSWITTVTASLLVLYMYFIKPFIDGQSIPEDKKRVPLVPGGLPIIGHGFKVFFNQMNFIKECYAKYGGVFQIKIFLINIVVVCDRNLVLGYLKEKEYILSFFHAMNDLNFDWTLFETGLLEFRTAVNIFRRAVGYKQEYLLSKVEEEGKKVIQRLKSLCKNAGGSYKCILNTEMNWYITRTSFQCFAPIELSDDVVRDLRTFYHFTDLLIMLSYLIPRRILKFTCNWRIRQIKRKLAPHFAEEIQKYMDDPTKCDSTLIRMAIDLEAKLTNAQLAEIVVGFIYLSATNTTIALTNTLTNLALPENKAMLKKIRRECQESKGDIPKLLAAPYLNAFIIETARLTSQIMAIQRTPEQSYFCLGDYFIGNKISHVALSPQMLQVYGNSSEVYHKPTEFIPERFTGNEAEPQTWPNIIAWGGGRHACPGRTFAINQVKIALSQLLLDFDFKIDQDLEDFNYFAVVAFGQRKVHVQISERKIPAGLEIQ